MNAVDAVEFARIFYSGTKTERDFSATGSGFSSVTSLHISTHIFIRQNVFFKFNV
jgi:hypothetical protein